MYDGEILTCRVGIKSIQLLRRLASRPYVVGQTDRQTDRETERQTDDMPGETRSYSRVSEKCKYIKTSK
jgi:hypothetical protein